MIIQPQTERFSKLPKTFMKTYKNIFKQKELKNTINNFLKIGWSDPFPNEHQEDFIAPDKAEDHVYHPSRMRD